MTVARRFKEPQDVVGQARLDEKMGEEKQRPQNIVLRPLKEKPCKSLTAVHLRSRSKRRHDNSRALRELAAGLRNHLRETENQVKRLEQVFEKIGESPKGVDCPAIDGLIKEADEVAGEIDDKTVLDAAIIGSAQAVEHYEISRCGTLIAWAKELGHDKAL
jgi:Domain of unknown function (DUF892)